MSEVDKPSKAEDEYFARQELERCKQAGENDDAAQEQVRRAEARVRAAERAS